MFRIAIFFLIILLALPLHAGDVAEGAASSSAIVLRADILPRPSAFAGAYTAIANDEAAIYYNPAGLAGLFKGAVSLNHMQWFQDIRIDNLSAVYKIGDRVGLGAGFSYLSMPTIQGKDAIGDPTEPLTISTSIVSVSGAYHIIRGLDFGTTLKYFNDNLAGFSGSGFAADAGLLVHSYVKGLRFGFTAQNLGGQIKYDQESENIPLTFRSGLAYMVSGIGLTFAGEWIKSTDTESRFAIGVEYRHKEWFSLRVGNQIRSGQAFTPAFGGGLFLQNTFYLDYSFYSDSDLGMTHRVGLTYRFHLAGKRRTSNEYAPDFSPVLMAPVDLSVQASKDKLIIEWSKVPGAKYYVYAKTETAREWKRLSKSPLYSTRMEFNKPKGSITLMFRVSSVINGKESPFSKEVRFEVR